jgi:distribution and morphology protein 31
MSFGATQARGIESRPGLITFTSRDSAIKAPTYSLPLRHPSLTLTATIMAFSAGIGPSRSAVTRQVAANKFAAFDRYRAIRRFFRQEHATASRYTALSSKRMTAYPGILTQRTCTSSSTRVEDGTRSAVRLLSISGFRRTFATQNTTPENPSRSDEGDIISPRNSKAHIPLENTIDGQNDFPHARDHENYSRFFRKLAESVPHARRPTRDDLLKVATNFWQRFSIHFKWFTLRSFRKYNADDISAFISWFLVSQTLWILVGT